MSTKISAGGVKKTRNQGLKVVTANRLMTGEVVYRLADGAWTDDLDQAEVVEADAAMAALSAASADEGAIVGPYLMDVAAAAARIEPIGRGRLRESIRFFGPTIHPEFGRYRERQQEAA